LDISYFENHKSEYGKRIIPFTASTTEGAELKVYFEKTDGSAKIMNASYGGETFHHQYTYYFKDVNDFLVIERLEHGTDHILKTEG
jgi:hypothetical protein